MSNSFELYPTHVPVQKPSQKFIANFYEVVGHVWVDLN